jgi:Putative heavy-metal-binding
MRAGALGALFAGLAASACGQIEPMRIAARGGNVPVVAVLKSLPAGAAQLGQVSATTCLNRFWDSRPGWDAALDSLKQEAARKGANALTGVRYEEASVLLCASALRVSGTAVKLP